MAFSISIFIALVLSVCSMPVFAWPNTDLYLSSFQGGILANMIYFVLPQICGYHRDCSGFLQVHELQDYSVNLRWVCICVNGCTP